MTIKTLNFHSNPGIYEIVTDGGYVYEIILPENPTETGFLLISKESGKPDSLVGRDLLVLLEIFFKVGDPGKIILFQKGEEKIVQTKTVVSIQKVE